MKPILILSPGRTGSEWQKTIISKLLRLQHIDSVTDGAGQLENCFKTILGTDRVYKRHETFSAIIDANIDAHIALSIRDPRDIAISAAYYNKHDPINYLTSGWQISWMQDYLDNKDKIDHAVMRLEDGIVAIGNALRHWKISFDAHDLISICTEHDLIKLKQASPRHYRSGEFQQWKKFDVDFDARFEKYVKAFGY